MRSRHNIDNIFTLVWHNLKGILHCTVPQVIALLLMTGTCAQKDEFLFLEDGHASYNPLLDSFAGEKKLYMDQDDCEKLNMLKSVYWAFSKSLHTLIDFAESGQDEEIYIRLLEHVKKARNETDKLISTWRFYGSSEDIRYFAYLRSKNSVIIENLDTLVKVEHMKPMSVYELISMARKEGECFISSFTYMVSDFQVEIYVAEHKYGLCDTRLNADCEYVKRRIKELGLYNL